MTKGALGTVPGARARWGWGWLPSADGPTAAPGVAWQPDGGCRGVNGVPRRDVPASSRPTPRSCEWLLIWRQGLGVSDGVKRLLVGSPAWSDGALNPVTRVLRQERTGSTGTQGRTGGRHRHALTLNRGCPAQPEGRDLERPPHPGPQASARPARTPGISPQRVQVSDLSPGAVRKGRFCCPKPLPLLWQCLWQPGKLGERGFSASWSPPETPAPRGFSCASRLHGGHRACSRRLLRGPPHPGRGGRWQPPVRSLRVCHVRPRDCGPAWPPVPSRGGRTRPLSPAAPERGVPPVHAGRALTSPSRMFFKSLLGTHCC